MKSNSLPISNRQQMHQQMFKSIPQLHFSKPARDKVNEKPWGKALVEKNVNTRGRVELNLWKVSEKTMGVKT